MNEVNDKKISRRKFLGLSSSAIAMMSLAGFGLSEGFTKNEPTIEIKDILDKEYETDVLVIGSGMAGLFASVKAHDAGAKVMMVSKGRLGSSGQTPFAKGIFSYDESEEKLSADEFVAKVSRSALGTNNPVFTRQLVENSYARVEELREWGFFDSPLYNLSFSKPMNERNIPRIERVMITNLIEENGHIIGAAGFSMDEDKVIIFKAKTIILCTGAGGFKPNGFPIGDLTHDGTIMAYEIGAKVTGKEWNDGHPGSVINAAASFDNWHGMFEKKPETTSVDIHHDLGVDLNYTAYKNGGPVKMGPPDAQGSTLAIGGPYVPQEFQRTGPPAGGRNDKEGRPPRNERDEKDGGGPGMPGGAAVGGSSAGLAIHKSEGLVPINDKCESTIKGLYAAGDALGSYMSGGIYTQIGSSLAGSAVQGAIAGEAAANYSKEIELKNISIEKIVELKEEILAPLKREAGFSPAWVTQTLQGIMIPNFVLYIKKESMLKAAFAYIEELRDHNMPLLIASDMHGLRLAHETKNMIISAQMKLEASLMRKESRCSHYRLDYPQMDEKNWQAWINIYKDKDGKMQLEKQPFGTWPSVNS